VVAARTDVASKIYEQQLTTHLEQAAHLGNVLRLTPKDMQARLRDAMEQTTAKAHKP
jgi:hypothetical protein